MRATIFVGFLLMALGATALFQIKNGPFMFAVGHLTHWPPEDAADVSAEFDKLAQTESGDVGASLALVADARISCVAELSGVRAPRHVQIAFGRMNLVLLGAGVNSFSSVIPPVARRVPELRRDLTNHATEWRIRTLDKAEKRKLDEAMDAMLDPEAPIYRGLDLAASFGHLDLRKMVDAMRAGGETLHLCVIDRALRS